MLTTLHLDGAWASTPFNEQVAWRLHELGVKQVGRTAREWFVSRIWSRTKAVRGDPVRANLRNALEEAV